MSENSLSRLWFFVPMRQFHFDFLLFSRFFGSDLFPNGFRNPFVVHSTPSFLFEINFHFSLVVFFHMRHFDIDFLFFLKIFGSNFLEMFFSIHS